MASLAKRPAALTIAVILILIAGCAPQQRKNYPAERASALHDLFAWCLEDGQQAAPDLGYVRLPAEVTSKAVAALAANVY